MLGSKPCSRCLVRTNSEAEGLVQLSKVSEPTDPRLKLQSISQPVLPQAVVLAWP